MLENRKKYGMIIMVVSMLSIVLCVLLSSSLPGIGLMTNLMNYMYITNIEVSSNFMPPLTNCSPYNYIGVNGCNIVFVTKYFVAAGLVSLSYGILMYMGLAPTRREIMDKIRS